MFAKYQPTSKKKMDTITGAGSMIGFLERLVIGACLVYGQFASIGLVFTAKSIAHYNKISENPAFAEYYLIGSLFSILSALLAAWLCLWIWKDTMSKNIDNFIRSPINWKLIL